MMTTKKKISNKKKILLIGLLIILLTLLLIYLVKVNNTKSANIINTINNVNNKITLTQFFGMDYDYRDYELYEESVPIDIYKILTPVGGDPSLAKEDYHLILDKDMKRLISVNKSGEKLNTINLVDVYGNEIKDDISLVIFADGKSWHKEIIPYRGTTSYFILTENNRLYSVINDWSNGTNSTHKIIMKDKNSLEVSLVSYNVSGILKSEFDDNIYILSGEYKSILNLDTNEEFYGYKEAIQMDFEEEYYFYSNGYVGYSSPNLLFAENGEYIKFKYAFDGYLVDVQDKIFKIVEEDNQYVLEYIGVFKNYEKSTEKYFKDSLKHIYNKVTIDGVTVLNEKTSNIIIEDTFIWDGKNILSGKH